MAKPPVTENRFRIYIETSILESGPLVEQLTLMGFDKIGQELITDVKTFNHRPRKVHEIDNTEFAMAWVDEHPDFSRGHLIEHFVAHGREAGTAGTVLQRLVEQGMVIRIVPGRFRKAMKALPAPANEKPPSDPDRKPSRELIKETIGRRKRFKSIELTKRFKAEGRTGSEMTSALYRMLDAGEIKRLDVGEYEVVDSKQAKRAPASPPRKKTRPPNPIARYDISNKQLILRFLDGKDEFNTSDLVELFKAEGRPPKSISPQVYVMEQDKLIKKISLGKYQVLVKGKKASAGSAQASVNESPTQEG